MAAYGSQPAPSTGQQLPYPQNPTIGVEQIAMVPVAGPTTGQPPMAITAQPTPADSVYHVTIESTEEWRRKEEERRRKEEEKKREGTGDSADYETIRGNYYSGTSNNDNNNTEDCDVCCLFSFCCGDDDDN
ncbi:uncharacterized protein [Diadema antillarum]|uniref:uncharacterized protein n=1 Tax=Diadema antillarum TaxID=105358 RepID=UPI003A84E582